MTAPTATATARLTGKVAIVTGGADGIGRATCLRLAEAGATVVVLDRNGDKAAEVVATIEARDGRALAVIADVTVEAQVSKAVSDAIAKFGRIDVLVNNAAIPGVQKPTHEVTEAEFDELFDVDVKGVFFCTKHVIPHMQGGGGGSVIHISSINGLVGNKDVPLYHAAKGAVRLMAKTDAVVYAEDKIRFNSVHPGSIRTALSEKLAAIHPDGPDAYFKWLADMHPLGHQGEPDDIAYGVVYLASDESKFVTGTELVIDGGYTAQ